MSEPTIGAGFARGLMELAVAKGASRQALAEGAQIDLAALEDQDARIRFASYVALMRAAKTLCGDPALALHYGEAVDIADVSIVGLIGLAAETMGEALAQLNRYVRLVVEAEGAGPDRFQLVRDREGLWLVDTRQNPNAFPELTESAFAQLVCSARRVSGGTLSVTRVLVTHAAPAHRAEYERIFRAPVVFEADRNAMLVGEHWLTHRVAQLPRYMFGVLTGHAESLLQDLESARSSRGQIERLLMPILHTGEANIEVVAGQMGLSRQTLYRKLKAEGVTFEKVLDELRHRMARHYLSGGKVSVNEAAYLVGFSDPGAFSRAFKRWTGSSPRDMRPKGTSRP